MVSGAESSEGNAIVDVDAREKSSRRVKKKGVRGVYLTVYITRT